MRLVVILLLLSSWLFGQAIPEIVANDPFANRITLETIVPEDAVYVGESVWVIIRVGVDRALLREGLVQPYARPLDLPIHIEAMWLRPDGPLAARFVPPSRRPDGKATVTRSVAVNDAVSSAIEAEDITRHGMRLATFEIHRDLTPRRVGELTLDSVTVRYALATKYSVDFLGNRLPEDRIDGAVRGEPASLSVLPLPTSGRPPGFHGLIGRYRLESTSLEAKGPIAEGFSVHFTVAGDGNAEAIRQLRVEPIPGFRVRGILDPGGAAPRPLTLDLVPGGRTPHELPPIRIAVFDPTPPGAYRFMESTVVKLPAHGGVPGEAVMNLHEARELSWFEASGVHWRLLLLVPWLVLALGWVHLAQRDRDREDPLGAKARRAFRTLHKALRSEANPHQAFGAYLAARTRSQDPGIVDRALPLRLQHVGVPPELAHRISDRWLAGVDLRYGAATPAMSMEEAISLAEAMESALRKHRGRA